MKKFWLLKKDNLIEKFMNEDYDNTPLTRPESSLLY